ncbi:MAG: hypothetical protein WKF50_07400 [Nocardioides sp.]
MSHERDIFVRELRELWPAVEPHWKPVADSDIEEVRRQLDEHLAHTSKAGEAMLLADRLHVMVDRHEELIGDQRSVVCAAVTYFLEVDDAWNDNDVGGLSDDRRVVLAAELALRS